MWERAKYILHPADWLTSTLTGQFGISDYSNALKLGYDLETRAWACAVSLAEIPACLLPRVVAPGEHDGDNSP